MIGYRVHLIRARFNSQPPEGGWADTGAPTLAKDGFNSQPPEGGWARLARQGIFTPRFNSQPPEGGWNHGRKTLQRSNRFNSQPPEGGWCGRERCRQNLEFQLTAARRRLENLQEAMFGGGGVSTHSRPKAAGRIK